MSVRFAVAESLAALRVSGAGHGFDHMGLIAAPADAGASRGITIIDAIGPGGFGVLSAGKSLGAFRAQSPGFRAVFTIFWGASRAAPVRLAG